MRRTIAELVGESLREVGVLLLVFVSLDAVFYQGSLKPATMVALVLVAVMGFGLIVAGVLLERGAE